MGAIGSGGCWCGCGRGAAARPRPRSIDLPQHPPTAQEQLQLVGGVGGIRALLYGAEHNLTCVTWKLIDISKHPTKL